MRIKLMVLILLLATMNGARGFDGCMIDNGDGTFTVRTTMVNGHVYEGTAIPCCGDRVYARMHDHNDSYFSGIGNYSGSCDIYNINFQSDASGCIVPSTLYADP